MILAGCEMQQKDEDNSEIIAEAFGEKLTMSDISGNLNVARTKSDSQFIISRYSDQWVMDKIFFEEAKNAVGQNNKIDALVDDYKKSLIIHEWDQSILAEAMDTVIAIEEIDTFYQRSKKEYKLQEDIVRFLYVQFHESGDEAYFKNIWKTEDLLAINQFIGQYSGISFLDSEKWYYKSELKNLLPEKMYKKIAFSKPNNYSHSENETKFFVKILEKTDSDEDAPVSFVEEIIRERILHDRAKEILKRKKNSLYQKNIQNKVIKVYSKTDN